jgi:hypothetical protein
MKLLWLLLACLSIPSIAEANIGSVTSLTGEHAQLERAKKKSALTRSTGILSDDLIIVGSNTSAELKFIDNTNVKITANSRLVIDDFVYDPKNADAGKLGIKVALGSVRYASGQIAKNNPQQVNIKTPTATIAVRGTDFSMTVDEAGRSMVVLLPSCTTEEALKKYEIAGNCITGSIEVMTALGSVVLNQAFTATYVVDSNQPPLPPVQVPMDLSQVARNDSILKMPGAIVEARTEQEERKRPAVKETQEEKNSHQQGASGLAALRAQEAAETKIIAAATAGKVEDGTLGGNTCYPFNECGNEKGRNYYYKQDELRGNIISIRTGEKFDNVTYNVSVNSNDIETRTVGNGSTVVTVRQWNR